MKFFLPARTSDGLDMPCPASLASRIDVYAPTSVPGLSECVGSVEVSGDYETTCVALLALAQQAGVSAETAAADAREWLAEGAAPRTAGILFSVGRRLGEAAKREGSG